VTDRRTDRHTDTGDFIICPMLCYSNGTDKKSHMWLTSDWRNMINFADTLICYAEKLSQLQHVSREWMSGWLTAWLSVVDVRTVWVKKSPLRFSDILSKWLGIFSLNFTRLLYVPIYAGLQIFIQLSYLQLWQSYAILSATTQHSFRLMVDILSIWCELSHLIWRNFIRVADNW